MRTIRNKSGVIFIASVVQGQDKCPRAIINGSSTKLRDDYHGKLGTSRKLIKKLFTKF